MRRGSRACASAASSRSRWSRSRGSRARSRWTRSPRRRPSPATRPSLLAADRVPQLFPMLMTAAGTIAPAACSSRRRRRRAAGDRDRAAARRGRLGVRRAAGRERAGREPRRDVPRPRRSRARRPRAATRRELTPEQQAQQQAALEERIPDFDVVITTALVPGRPAPKLIPAARSSACGPAPSIVDLAAEAGGNCELTCPARRRARGRDDRRPDEPPVADGVPREPALLAQRLGAAPAPGAGRRARARLGRRDHGRRVRDASARRRRVTELPLVIELTILVLAIFLGFEVISKVPTMLHTPLMSGHERHPRDRHRRRDHRRRAAPTTRSRRSSASSRWCSRRRTWSAACSSPTGCSRCSSGGRSRSEDDGRVISDPDVLAPALPRHDHLLHPRAALPLVAEARAARQLGRRRRDARRDRDDARSSTGLENWVLIVVGSAIGSVVGRRRRADGEDDRDAADGGAVQRRRRRRGGARRARRVPRARRAGSPGTRTLSRSSLSALIGSVSFAGSLVAFAKLQELVSGRPIVFPGAEGRERRSARRRRRRSGSRSSRALEEQWAARRADRRSRSSSASCSCCRSAARTCRS